MEGATTTSSTTAAGPAAARSRAGTVLVWDAPNMDMGLGDVLGGKPRPDQRPRFDAVGRWVVGLAGDDGAEATIFTNIGPGQGLLLRPWIEAVRSFGYAVFAKPKVGDSDVDEDLLAHLRSHHEQGALRQVIVASADAAAMREPLVELAHAGVDVVVLGYAEVCGYALTTPEIRFVDLEDVPGAFLAPLGRLRLDHLPPEGLLLPPTKPLGG